LFTAGPPVARPPTPSCVVRLADEQRFANGETPFRTSYSPPLACPPPWNKIVLNWWGSVSGSQADRVGGLWIGQVELFRTTTPLTNPSPIRWHVDKDVTEYASVLMRNQNVTIIVPNYVGRGNPASIFVNATITFFETGPSYPEFTPPDLVYPLFSTVAVPWFVTNNSSLALGSRLTLPRQPTQVALEIYATPHSPCDEFWYAPDVACGGSPFREFRTFLDGVLVGVVIPFPLMYSGAINPGLWKPVPSIDALNIPSYVVDLTPFIGRLADGNPHTITLQISNYHDRWRIDGNLLYHLDYRAPATSGSITGYNFLPDPSINQTVSSSPTTLVVKTAARRSIDISGTVHSSFGNTNISIEQSLAFSNKRTIDLITLREQIQQSEVFVTKTISIGPQGNITTIAGTSYSLDAVFSLEFTYNLEAGVDSVLNETSKNIVNGKVFSTNRLDSIHAFTLGLYPGVEKTTEEFSTNGHNNSSVCGATAYPSCLTAVSERIDFGPLGFVVLGILLVLDNLRSIRNKKLLRAQTLFTVGYITAGTGVVLSFLKYESLNSLGVGILPSLLPMAPELGGCSSGICLAVLGLTRIRRFRE